MQATIKQLASGGPLPESISINGAPLLVEACLRRLPGKRVVLKGRWNTSTVAVKIFLKEKDYQKEVAGLKKLSVAGITAPSMIETWCDAGVWGVVLSWCSNAQSLQQQWASATCKAEKVEVIRRSLAVITQMHHFELIQNDIHLGNFLVSEGRVFVIDAASIESAEKKTDILLDNLALLLAQYPPCWTAQQKALLPEYIALNETQYQSLWRKVVRWRRYRLKKYLKKAGRPCTDYKALKTSGRFLVWRRDCDSPELHRILRNPDEAMKTGKILKDGKSATVVALQLEGCQWVIKRYNLKDFWHGIKRALKPSRAWVSWLNAHRLAFYDLPTPRVIAVIERRWGPFRRQAYLITEQKQGERLDKVPRQVAIGACPQIKEIFLGMACAGLSHGDMKASNWLMTQEGVTLIDLDAMKQHSVSVFFKKALKKDICRFLRNWSGGTRQLFQNELCSIEQMVDKRACSAQVD